MGAARTDDETVGVEDGALDGRRKKADRTRAKILDAAKHLFPKDGYANTSLDAVAEVAGVTKPTVYSHFKSKKGLFDAVIRQVADQRLALIESQLEVTDNVGADMTRLADFFISHIFSTKKVRWDRLAAAESMQHPEVGEAFYAAGPERLLKRFAVFLSQHVKAGRLEITDTALAAEQFFGMLLCLDDLRMRIGKPAPSATVQRKRAKAAVSVFMAAYGVEP